MPFHHSNDTSTCFLCEEKLKTAHPDIAAWFKEIKKNFPSAHISWAWRGKADQDQFVAEKKSKRPWPTSKHNATQDGKPCSLALDLFCLDAVGNCVYPSRFFFLIAAKSKQLDFKNVEWAGGWKGEFKETCHYQLKMPG